MVSSRQAGVSEEAEARMLGGDHVVMRGEIGHERVPLAAVRGAVQQEHGPPRAGAAERDGAAAHRRFRRRWLVHPMPSLVALFEPREARQRLRPILHLRRREAKGILGGEFHRRNRTHDRPEVDTHTLKSWLSDGSEIALIDVREAGQFGEAHPFFAVPLPCTAGSRCA